MERAFIDWLRRGQCRAPLPSLPVGIGDDAAVIRSLPSDNADSSWILTTDAIADGTHFDATRDSLEHIGRKAMAVNLSDLAAMAAIPRFALVTFQLPQTFDLAECKRLYQAIEQMATRFDCRLIGGDTNRWDGKLVINVVAIGSPSPGPDGEPHLGRLNGGRAGDVVFVSGELGGSLLGHHLTFTPRIELAKRLNRRYPITALTDISDSLALDLAELASASNAGFEIKATHIPISASAVEAANERGTSPLEAALYDGEDFELIVCIPPDQADSVQADDDLGVKLSRIGRLTSKRECRLVDRTGTSRLLEVRGYDH